MLTDAIGRVHVPVAAGAVIRIVSLVPSLTELLCELGLQDRLVGRTGFCIHPREQVASIAKIGGTKDVNIEKIRALAPTHLVVNIDENEKPTVELLAQFIPHVIVTHPQAPTDNLQLYRLLGAVFAVVPGVAARAQALCMAFDAALAALSADIADQRLQQHVRPKTILYCIWQDPWMTVSRETYIARMLELIGWRQWEALPLPLSTSPPSSSSSSSHADRLAPDGARPARYPCFAWSSDVICAIDAVLLSTEPYSFRQTHADRLQQQVGKPVQIVDGELLSWYGSRAIAGLAYLKELRATSGD